MCRAIAIDGSENNRYGYDHDSESVGDNGYNAIATCYTIGKSQESHEQCHSLL